jgi:trehalose 6-phosphate phosphatase
MRPDGHDKGDAVAALLDMPAMQGRFPVFVGDDLTDEHGFAAARDLGGFGVLVGAARPTAARYRIPDVEAVLDWLEAAP